MCRPIVHYENRPICQTPGCGKPCDNKNSAANPIWRKYCPNCHIKRTKNYREQLKLINNVPKCLNETCQNEVTILGTNKEGKLKYSLFCSVHGGKEYHVGFRKNYCENIDGRLGFKCTTTIIWEGMLDVDHIDGNSRNNSVSNLQTLCSCCHRYKTWVNKDGQSPGRKTLKEKYKNNSVRPRRWQIAA